MIIFTLESMNISNNNFREFFDKISNKRIRFLINISSKNDKKINGLDIEDFKYFLRKVAGSDYIYINNPKPYTMYFKGLIGETELSERLKKSLAEEEYFNIDLKSYLNEEQYESEVGNICLVGSPFNQDNLGVDILIKHISDKLKEKYIIVDKVIELK